MATVALCLRRMAYCAVYSPAVHFGGAACSGDGTGSGLDGNEGMWAMRFDGDRGVASRAWFTGRSQVPTDVFEH